MAKDKKGFILYTDLIHTVNKLPNDKAGELFKHILSYVNDENPQTDDILIDVTFEQIKQQLKRDLVKYEARADRSRLNGALGGRPPKPKETQITQQVKTEPRKPDIVNVNDTVNVIVNDKVINKKVYSKEIHDCLNQCLLFFPKHLHPKDKTKSLDTLEKLIRIDDIPAGQIIHIVEKTRNDDFWAKNFLSLTKLRKKNKDDIMYIVVFNEKIKSNENRKNNKGATGHEIAAAFGKHFATDREGI